MSDTRLNTALSLQRKSAITQGGAFDLAGQVEVVRMENLEMEKTIFGGLKGLPRMFMAEKLGKEAVWPQAAATEVENIYAKTTSAPIDQRLVDFMQHECCLLYTSPSPRDRG